MLEKIWKPDTYFHNGLDSYLHSITRPNKLLRISENGDITYSIRLVVFLMKIIIIYNLFSTTDIYHFHEHTFQNKYNSIFAEPSYLRLTCLNLLHYFNCTTSFISLQPQFISFWITLLKIHLDTHFQHKI